MTHRAITELVSLGGLPPEDNADPDVIKRHELLIRSIETPVSDDGARLLVTLFGEDGCFGLAASLVTKIETAPSWPIVESLTDTRNPWVVELIDRSRRGGRVL